MSKDPNYGLEALREAKTWAMWIVGVATAAFTATGIFSKSDIESRMDVKGALIFGGIAFAMAVTEIACIPGLIAQLQENDTVNPMQLGALFVFKLSEINFVLHFFVILTGMFCFRILWRDMFKSDGPI